MASNDITDYSNALGMDQEEMPEMTVTADRPAGGSSAFDQAIDSILSYAGDGLDDETRSILDMSKSILNDSFASNLSSGLDLVNADIAKTSGDLAATARTGDDGWFSQFIKGTKDAYSGLDAEGKKFMWNTLTGLLNYNTVSSLRKNQSRMADAAMMNAQTNAGTLRNKIDQQATTGQMRFNQPRGLIYRDIAETKGVKPMGSV